MDDREHDMSIANIFILLGRDGTKNGRSWRSKLRYSEKSKRSRHTRERNMITLSTYDWLYFWPVQRGEQRTSNSLQILYPDLKQILEQSRHGRNWYVTVRTILKKIVPKEKMMVADIGDRYRSHVRPILLISLKDDWMKGSACEDWSATKTV